MKEGIEVVHIALRYRAGTAFGPRPKLAGLANRFDNMANVMFHCQLLPLSAGRDTDPASFLSALLIALSVCSVEICGDDFTWLA
jgi:hypothetical protein